MKINITNRFAFASALLFYSLSSCEEKGHSRDSLQNTALPVAVTPVQMQSNTAIKACGIEPISKRLSPSFQFERNLGSLGKKVSPELMKTIEKESQFLPELHDSIQKGWKIYSLEAQNDGGLTLIIADGYLIAFGYAINAPASESLDDTAKFMMDEFKYSQNSLVEVMDANFDGVPIEIKNYVHKSNETIKALVYSKNGISRSLEFYDSSKVDASKLLPASPSVLGKDAIDEMKPILKSSEK